MSELLQNMLISEMQGHFDGARIEKKQIIQSLWSGYGEIRRYHIGDKPYVVKMVNPAQQQHHPRGWNTSLSHQRKLDSYQNELLFYRHFATRTNQYCRVPQHIASGQLNEMSWLVMEDLDSLGFTYRCVDAPFPLILKGLSWLANFHAQFLTLDTSSLWPIGTYWHLATRPDEYQKMADGPLKKQAVAIDAYLNQCQFQTLLHGDAKLANFCFSADFSDLAAVDFQYVGRGVGIKDVVYFLGSCLDDDGLSIYADTLVNMYFEYLRQAVENNNHTIDIDLVEQQWRQCYCFAWADFERFLIGWASTHVKMTEYSQQQTDQALAIIAKLTKEQS